jgi:DNA-3-methyladenine glycosylase
MFKPLPRSFYEPAADVVAAALLGHWLVRNTPAGPCGGPIVETEAYLYDDPAAHSFIGETPRNRVMFGPPGHAYVYFIYGNHYCLNAVCRPPGYGEAVLVRAIEVEWGEPRMRAHRPVTSALELTSGPAKLCQALDIDRRLDGTDLCDPGSPVIIAANPRRELLLSQRGPLVTTTRIGIVKAADKPLRFCLAASPYVSRRVKPETSVRSVERRA